MSTSTTKAVRGVNVVGYHLADSGLGQVARSLVNSLRTVGLDVVEIDASVTAGAVDEDPLHDATIAVVTAARLPDVAAIRPEPFAPGRLRIGYWFWELSVVPAEQAPAFGLIDRVWAPSE